MKPSVCVLENVEQNFSPLKPLTIGLVVLQVIHGEIIELVKKIMIQESDCASNSKGKDCECECLCFGKMSTVSKSNMLGFVVIGLAIVVGAELNDGGE